MALRLFLIRHGETEWSRERRFAGGRDITLSVEGRRQCEAAAARLAREPIVAVYTSPLERARTSAETIAKPHRLEVIADTAFREMGFGAWEGMTRDEVAVRFPDGYELWRTNPERARPPGGESLVDVVARVNLGIDELRAVHEDETLILVTHAVTLRLIVLGALGLGPERLWSVDASPAGITEIEYSRGWATIHRMNTLAHLGDGVQ